MRVFLARLLIQVSLLAACALPAAAVPIAAWNFLGGNANDVVGSYDLTAVGGGPTIAGGFASFSGIDGAPSFLETVGFGASAQWTISLFVRSGTPLDQGTFQGIFSNNNSASAANSWQLESANGSYVWRVGSSPSTTFALGAATGGWDHIVLRKLNSNDGDAWLNGVQVFSSIGRNPGGLQNFRLGTNRNTTSLLAMDLDDVLVFNSVENPLLLAPEPSSAVLLGLGLAALARRRARVSR